MIKNDLKLISKLTTLLCFALLSSVTLSQENEAYIQKLKKYDIDKDIISIRLNEAIEQGLRQNYDQQQRKILKELIQIEWSNKRDQFWLPNLELKLNAGPQRLGTIVNGARDDGRTAKAFDGEASLSFGDYTLFNWGKDYLEYQNAKDTYNRELDLLKEEKSHLRHDILMAFFELLFQKQNLKAKKEQVKLTSFIYRFNQERVSLKKISSQDYYLSRSEYLKAQRDYQIAKQDYALKEQSLSALISETEDMSLIKYFTSEKIKFTKLRLTYAEALKLSEEKNTSIQNSKLNLRIAKRDLELSMKNDLPLPKISLGLGAYKYTFGKDKNYGNYETGASNSNVELVATINATWSLLGKGGILNSRERRKSKLKKYLSFSKLEQTKHNIRNQLQQYFNSVKILETKISALNMQKKNAQKAFDRALENYMAKRTSFINYIQALNDKISSHVELERAKKEHLNYKIKLAKTVGIDDFPGESFERLTISTK